MRDVPPLIMGYPVRHPSIASLFNDKGASVGGSTVPKGYCINARAYVTILRVCNVVGETMTVLVPILT